MRNLELFITARATGAAYSRPGLMLDLPAIGGPNWPCYKNRGGYSGAAAKRRANKTRNRLRARGQHRDAVR